MSSVKPKRIRVQVSSDVAPWPVAAGVDRSVIPYFACLSINLKE